MERCQRLPGRSLTLAILLAACLLVGADTLAWNQMQRILRHRLDLLIRQAASLGWRVDTGRAVRGGWPVAATLSIETVRAHGGAGLLAGGVDWSSARVVVSLAPWRPRDIEVRAPGPQLLSAPGLQADLRIQGARTAIHLPSQGRHRMSFDARRLRLDDAGAPGGATLTIDRLRGAVRWTGQAQALLLDLGAIAWSRPGAAAGEAIAHASLEASLTQGAVPRLLLERAELRWGDASLALSGSACLSGTPRGEFSLAITGATALLDKAVAWRSLTPQSALAIHAVLSLIADAEPQRRQRPTAPTIEVPLAWRAGEVWLGQIPLVTFPQHWSVPGP